MNTEKKYNLKFINFKFKSFIRFFGSEPASSCKNWKETGADVDGDIVFAIPRFSFGKQKITKLFIHGIGGYYKYIHDLHKTAKENKLS